MTLVTLALTVTLACAVPAAAGEATWEVRIPIGPEREQLFQLAGAAGEKQAREGMAEYSAAPPAPFSMMLAGVSRAALTRTAPK